MCGCGKKRAAQRAQQAAAAEMRLQEMEDEAAQELVPLGMNPVIHLPTKIARAVNGRDVIVAPEGDNRIYVNADRNDKPIVIRGGHDGLLPQRMREQIVARVPGAFVAPDESVSEVERVPEPEFA